MGPLTKSRKGAGTNVGAGAKRANKEGKRDGIPPANAAGEEGDVINLKELMAPIEYHPSLADEFRGWKPVRFDSKTLGRQCDFTGMLSIETIEGDEADALLRKLGRSSDRDAGSNSTTKKKRKAAAAEAVPQAPVANNAKPVNKMAQGGKNNEKSAGGGSAAVQRETGRKKIERARAEGGTAIAAAVEGASERVPGAVEGGVSDEGEPKKKKRRKQLTQRERKELKRARLEAQSLKKAAVAASMAADSPDEDTEEDGVAGGSRAGEIDADYDDEYEYEEWGGAPAQEGGGGGVMLRKCLVKALTAQGFSTPTPIQQAVLPVALAQRRDIFGAAATGSGKTLAFALPMLQRILESGSFVADRGGPNALARQLSGLVLSPTRELALQVRDHIAAAARYTPIQVMAIVGGLADQKQQRLLDRRPHVIVATPGRLWENMRLGHAYLTTLHMLLCLVIDEADRMLETGHFDELANILRALPAIDPNSKRRRQIRADAGETDDAEEGDDAEEITSFVSRKADAPPASAPRHFRRQTLVFSATLIRDFQWRQSQQGKGKKKGKGGRGEMAGSEEGLGKSDLRKKSVEKLMDELQLPDEPHIIDLAPEGKVSDKVEQLRVECLALDQEVHIYRFLMKHFAQGAGGGGAGAGGRAGGKGGGGGRVIVFVNAIGEARRLSNLLTCLRVKTFLLHSGLQQRQRLKHLDGFKALPESVLISTDIAARGLDIPAVQVVLHYHVPKVPSVYVHRCGRTARGVVEHGLSILLVSPQEQFHLMKIRDVVGHDVALYEDEGPFLEEARKRVNVARKLEAELNKVGKDARDKSWMKQQAAEMELDISDDGASDSDEAGGGGGWAKGGGGKASSGQRQRTAQLQEQLDRMLDSSLLPKGVSPRFITGSYHAQAGLPEMLAFGAVGGSLRDARGGKRRLKPGKKGKKKKTNSGRPGR